MMKKTGKNFAPGGLTTEEDYKKALGVLLPSLTPTRFKMLRFHYGDPDLAPAELAGAMGWNNNPTGVANLKYGELGRVLAEHLQHGKKKVQKVHYLADFDWPEGVCHWIMWQNLARALEAVGIVDKPRRPRP